MLLLCCYDCNSTQHHHDVAGLNTSCDITQCMNELWIFKRNIRTPKGRFWNYWHQLRWIAKGDKTHIHVSYSNARTLHLILILKKFHIDFSKWFISPGCGQLPSTLIFALWYMNKVMHMNDDTLVTQVQVYKTKKFLWIRFQHLGD